MKEYTPSGKTPEELAAEIKKLEEESENMTEWPDVDNYVDDWTTMHTHRGFCLPIFKHDAVLYRSFIAPSFAPLNKAISR